MFSRPLGTDKHFFLQKRDKFWLLSEPITYDRTPLAKPPAQHKI